MPLTVDNFEKRHAKVTPQRAALLELCRQAKEGDVFAKELLWDVYKLRVYTWREILDFEQRRKEGKI